MPNWPFWPFEVGVVVAFSLFHRQANASESDVNIQDADKHLFAEFYNIRCLLHSPRSKLAYMNHPVFPREELDDRAEIEGDLALDLDAETTLRMQEFSPPVSRLATHFDETWDFASQGSGTRVDRSFRMYARSALTRPLLWMISVLLKKAIARHLRQMRQNAAV